MAAYDWAPSFGSPYYSHSAWLASQRPQQQPQPAGFRVPQQQSQPLPQLPPLSIPGLAPMPNLPQFDTSFPGLPAPNMPGMNVPQLQTQGLGLPGYQRPSYPDQGPEYAKLGASLSAMLQGYGGQPGGGMGQVNSPIDASPVYSSAFSQGLDRGVQGQAGRSVGSLPSYAGQHAGELQQTYGDAARQTAAAGVNRGQRQRAAQAAPQDLASQTARAGSGQAWGNNLLSLYGDQQSLQNQQRNMLVNLLLGGML